MQRRLREQGGGRGRAGGRAGRQGQKAAARKEAWKSCRFSAAAFAARREREEQSTERESFVHVSAAAGGGCRLAAAANAAAARGRQIHVLDGRQWCGVRGDSNCQNCCHAARGSRGRAGVCTGTAARENREGMDEGGFGDEYD